MDFVQERFLKNKQNIMQTNAITEEKFTKTVKSLIPVDDRPRYNRSDLPINYTSYDSYEKYNK